MKFNSPTFSAASGSMGGTTYARNRFGAYTRKRSVPVQPNSTKQVQAREAFRDSVVSWASLTAAQREAWKNYADQVAVKDALGQTIYLTAQNWFIATQALRNRHTPTATPKLDAPTVFNRSSLATPTYTVTLPSSIQVAFDTGDEWATAKGGILQIRIGRPQPKSVNFFKGPFTLLGAVIRGDDPPSSPVTFTSPFPLASGQRVFFEASALTADNRLTESQITYVDIP
jgi:hypothetical protein